MKNETYIPNRTRTHLCTLAPCSRQNWKWRWTLKCAIEGQAVCRRWNLLEPMTASCELEIGIWGIPNRVKHRARAQRGRSTDAVSKPSWLIIACTICIGWSLAAFKAWFQAGRLNRPNPCGFSCCLVQWSQR